MVKADGAYFRWYSYFCLLCLCALHCDEGSHCCGDGANLRSRAARLACIARCTGRVGTEVWGSGLKVYGVRHCLVQAARRTVR